MKTFIAIFTFSLVTLLFAQTIPTGGGHLATKETEHIVALMRALNKEIKHACPAAAPFSNVTEMYTYLVMNNEASSPCKKSRCIENDSIKVLLRELVHEKKFEQYLIEFESLTPKKATHIKKYFLNFLQYEKPLPAHGKDPIPTT